MSLVRLLQPGGKVHRFPMRCVVELAAKAHFAENGGPGFNADTCPAEIDRRKRGAPAHLLRQRSNFACTNDRDVDMAFQIFRRVEERVNRVPNHLVDHAAVPLDHPVHLRKIGIEKPDQCLRIDPSGESGKPFDIGEERGDLPRLSGHAHLRSIKIPVDHAFRQILSEAGARPPLRVADPGIL